MAGSLPDLRRRTSFSPATTRRRRFTAFWTAFAAALVRPGFFRHLAVRDEHAAARRYAMWVAILTGMILALGVAVTGMNNLPYAGSFLSDFNIQAIRHTRYPNA